MTAYDYTTRFGRLGWLADRLAFRPLMGWATAWSFDRLRLWLEQGIRPEDAARAAAVHAIARLGLAAIFLYHGVVPKLLAPHPDEIALFGAAGVPGGLVPVAMTLVAGLEVALALALVVLSRSRWPSLVCATFAVVATVGVGAVAPEYLGAAFPPSTLNVGIGALALIDLIVLPAVPFAARCGRHPRARAR